MFFARVNSINEDVHFRLVSRMWVRSFGITFAERGAHKLLHPLQWRRTNAMLSQSTINSTVRSTACSGIDQTNYQSSALLAFCDGNPPVTGRFPSQRTSNACPCYHVTYMLSVLEAVNHVASTTFNASNDYKKSPWRPFRFRCANAIIKTNLHFDGLAQDCSNSIALAMELLESCTKPSI